MGGRVKNENCSPLDQTQRNFLYIFWRIEMQKLTNQNRGGESKIKILALWTNGLPHSLQKAEKSLPKHSVKKQAKFKKVVKSSVQPS